LIAVGKKIVPISEVCKRWLRLCWVSFSVVGALLGFESGIARKDSPAQASSFSNEYFLDVMRNIEATSRSPSPDKEESSLSNHLLSNRRITLFVASLIVGLILFGPSDVRAQDEGERSVSGTVTSMADGKVMPGVNVQVQGKTIGTATDERGQYSLTVPSPQDTLVFSFVGFEDQVIPIQGRTTIDVTMQAQVEELSQVVVTGYGEETRAEVTGAVTQISGGELETISAGNTSNLMAGVSGLYTKQTSGLPGNDHRSLVVRGFGNPLVLVDGMEMSLDRVDPSDIESINVLKDASAAVYGARAGNGVVLVKTNRGSQQAPKINFSTSVSAQTPTAFPDHVNAGQYADMMREGALYMGVEPRFTQEEVQKYQNEAEGFESYDWYDATFKDYAMLSDYNLSVNGGNESVRYYLSGLYKDHQSALQSGDYRYGLWNLRANVDAFINEQWTASANVNFRREVRERPGQTMRDIFVDLNRVQPIYRPVLPDESRAAFGGFTRANPLASSKREKAGFRKSTNEWVEGQAEIAYDFSAVDGLSLSGVLGYRYGWGFTKDFRKEFGVYQYTPENDSYVQRATGGEELIERQTDRQWEIRPELSLDYQNTFGEKHDVEGLALVEFIESSYQQVNAERQGLFTTELPYLFAGNLDQVSNGGFANESGRASYVGRLQYGYDSRYIIEGTLRADASHKFPKDSRWGFFPSISAGWTISEESFMQGNAIGDAVNQMKLRLSYGQAGDDDVGAYQHLQGFFIRDYPRIIAGERRRIISEGRLPNESITWRNMTTYNIGLDLTFWNGLFSSTVDVYQRNSKDLFGTPQADYPDTFGASLPQLNINESRTRGVEIQAGHENNIGKLSYSLDGNISWNSKVWTEFSEAEYETAAERRVFKNEGKNRNRRVGYVAIGLFQSQEEIDNWDVDQDGDGNSTLRPGDIKYKDLNGDGKITQLDQKRIGYGSFPDMTYALNLGASYGNFSMGAQFQGASRFTIQVSDIARVPYFNKSTPFKYHYEHRWEPENPSEGENTTNTNPDAQIPYVDATGSSWTQNNNRTSTFWLKDGTYLRLKNLSLSYTIPESITNRLGIERFRITAAGSNLLTWDRLGIYSDAYDPESPGTQNARQYPLVKTYQLSIDLTL
jgi:TonB-linked SusC/RagA family outer membrane protein